MLCRSPHVQVHRSTIPFVWLACIALTSSCLAPHAHTVNRAEVGLSKNMSAIVGLNLMHLLVENKLSSFHSEVPHTEIYVNASIVISMYAIVLLPRAVMCTVCNVHCVLLRVHTYLASCIKRHNPWHTHSLHIPYTYGAQPHTTTLPNLSSSLSNPSCAPTRVSSSQ